MEDEKISIAREIYKKTLYYELSGMDLNEDGCAVLINSDKYMDEHPGSDKIGHIYGYDHMFSQLLRGLKGSLKDKETYEQYKDRMIKVDLPDELSNIIDTYKI